MDHTLVQNQNFTGRFAVRLRVKKKEKKEIQKIYDTTSTPVQSTFVMATPRSIIRE